MHFAESGAYRAWACIVEDEAPGLSGRLLTARDGDGGCHVIFRLNDSRVPLTEDGVDVLRDITRRMGVDGALLLVV